MHYNQAHLLSHIRKGARLCPTNHQLLRVTKELPVLRSRSHLHSMPPQSGTAWSSSLQALVFSLILGTGSQRRSSFSVGAWDVASKYTSCIDSIHFSFDRVKSWWFEAPVSVIAIVAAALLSISPRTRSELGFQPRMHKLARASFCFPT
jgi:hypothetical protein